MDEKKLISQLYCKIRNDNKTSKSIINDSYRKLKHNLCKIYKTMDVDFDSEMLKVMGICDGRIAFAMAGVIPAKAKEVRLT